MRRYSAEEDAGINFQTGSSSALVTAKVQVRDIKKYFDGMSVSDLIKETDTVQTVEELLGQIQPDLALVVAILVSTGWNLNDDVFTPAEVWKAKDTPTHKPMNDNHVSDRILGHIVQSRVLDKTGDLIVLDDSEQPPEEFDIEVAGVLYKALPQLAERIDEIIEKANAGEMFVSMEAWFPDFGYAIIDPETGMTKVIERTEATAFLTKHLKIYGGEGKYQGYKIGRVLKDIIFGAQGFVETPANPESVIKVAADCWAASGGFETVELSELPEGGVEDVDEKQMQELRDQLETAQSALKEKEAEVVSLQATVKEFEGKNLDGQIAELTSKIDEMVVTMEETSQKVEATEAEKVELQKKLDEVTKRAEKSEADLAEISKKEVARERLAQLAEVKSITDEEATLAELCEMTDETFAVVLKYAGETKAEDAEPENDEKPKEDDGEQAEAALNDVEEEKGADFNAQEVEKSDADAYLSMAKSLCGVQEKDEGGE